MATEPFLGTWKICDVTKLNGSFDVDHLQGSQFTLYKNGEVDWNVKSGAEWVGVGEELLPLLVCDTFEVLRERDGFTVVVLLR